ncbi:TetR/AcrR family transcriptional regulator [Elongatibacter sediminis]|uniref:TetR/AcrR family transcriptional regulator n=1 Tax=Elongatibacter sediminis TaxID=3119006 RepID=A0AAW9RBV6_9GAMM
MTRRNTRELILQTSLNLFNTLGEPAVTTNHIADEADISPGNLYYHFNSKQDIIVELFKRFVAQFDPIIDVPADSALEANDLWFQLHLSFEIKGQYRFLYRNLADITGRVPDLERAFRALFHRERQAAGEILAGLERRGALKIEPTERELLLGNLMLVLTYWIPYADQFVTHGMDDGSVQTRAIAGVLQLVIPYLRDPEREEFSALTRAYLEHAD